MSLVLGLDCGGSSVRTLALDDEGRPVFRGQGGPANIAATSPDLLVRSLQSATQGCPAPDAVAGCFAGLLTNQDRDRAEGILRDLFPAARVRAWPDYAAALAAAPETTAVMICGTGSVVAWWEDGEIRKAGGGGPLLGDEGSAYVLGKRVLADALFPPHRWTPNLILHVQKRYQTQEPNEVVAAIYRGGSPVAEIALAAKVAVDDWEAGEPSGVERVEEHLLSILRQLEPIAKPGALITVTGGLWSLSPRLLPRMIELDEERGLNLIAGNDVRIGVLADEPVQGAANLARRLLSS